MRIDHGCFQILVPKKLLNRPNISSGFQEVSSKSMAQGMTRYAFVYTSAP